MQAITCWAIIIFQRNGQEETKTDDKEKTKMLDRRQDYTSKKSTGGSSKLPAAGCRESSILKVECLSSSLADPAASCGECARSWIHPNVSCYRILPKGFPGCSTYRLVRQLSGKMTGVGSIFGEHERGIHAWPGQPFSPLPWQR